MVLFLFACFIRCPIGESLEWRLATYSLLGVIYNKSCQCTPFSASLTTCIQ